MAYEAYGKGVYGPYYTSGAPVAGTNEVQTITIGGTPTGGTFKLSLDGRVTVAITWVNVNATLLASIQAAFNTITSANACVFTAGTLTAGIGTILATFSGGDYARQNVSLIAVADNSLTGTSPTIAVAETTPGVKATGRDMQPGSMMLDTTNGKLYVNTGTLGSPTWTVQA